MFERKNIIKENSKKERYHTPDEFPPRIKPINLSLQNQNKSSKKKFNKNNNYNPNTTENLSENSSNNDQNNIDLLNKKIISQQNDISYLKS